MPHVILDPGVQTKKDKEDKVLPDMRQCFSGKTDIKTKECVTVIC